MKIRMAVVDLDGTLTRSDGQVSARDRASLETLGRNGAIRAVATGRHLYAARKILPGDFPIDYLVFSSGAGVLDWRDQTLLQSHHLDATQVELATRECLARGLDFMVHHAVPDNHFFSYWSSGRVNPDFERRRTRHQMFGRAWDLGARIEMASQLLVIESGGRERMLEIFHTLKGALPDFNVIRATSPLDGKSLWIEIFPKRVAKSLAAQWLAERHGLEARQVLAVGNDYNDTDLLDWAGEPFVVANAPEDLKSHYRVVASHEEDGVSEAIARALSRFG